MHRVWGRYMIRGRHMCVCLARTVEGDGVAQHPAAALVAAPVPNLGGAGFASERHICTAQRSALASPASV
jgi:hypothetical protein